MKSTNQKYRVKVDKGHIFDLTKNDLTTLDIVRLGRDTFQIIDQNQCYAVEVTEINDKPKYFSVAINEQAFDIEIEDTLDQLIEKMGLSALVSGRKTDIIAPMPGLVLNIMIKEGEIVSKGDSILVLEAMKMENMIKAPGDGKIIHILTSKGSPVEKGELLIEID